MRRPLEILWLILLGSITLLSGCTGRKEKEVIAIEKTKTYHREGCPPVNMAKTKFVTIAEAKAEHLKPCPTCKPDTL